MPWKLEQLDLPADLQQFQGHKGIYEHPEDPTKLIRLYGTGGTDEHEVTAIAQNLFDDVEAHGFKTVSPKFRPVGKGVLAITVDKIAGRGFTFDETPHETDFNCLQHTGAMSALEEQHAYVQRQIFSSSQRFLIDIYGVHQCMYTDSGQAVLVDVDPMFSSGKNIFIDRCGIVQELAEGVAKYHTGNNDTLMMWRPRYARLLNKVFELSGYHELAQAQAKLVDIVLGIEITDSDERFGEADDILLNI